MLFKILSAMAQKHWNAATSTPIPFTTTPLPNFRQRSAIEIGPIPFILAQGEGSLIKSIPNRNTITAISILKYKGMTFYRAYLSQAEGAFIHLAVSDNDSKKILECRFYQPYHEIIPLWKDDAEALIANANQPYDIDLTWSFWLLDNPDPMIGGIIGCPIISGRNEDVDENGNVWQYTRSWVPGNSRITPCHMAENMMDANGEMSVFEHEIMSYSRYLKDNKQFEYILLSSVVTPNNDASVNYWLGIDIEVSDLTIYGPV